MNSICAKGCYITSSAVSAAADPSVLFCEGLVCLVAIFSRAACPSTSDADILKYRTIKIAEFLIPALPAALIACSFFAHMVIDRTRFPYRQIEKIKEEKIIHRIAAVGALVIAFDVARAASDSNWELYEKNIYPIVPTIQGMILSAYFFKNLPF